MKGITLIIWIILLNIFDSHVCLTTVRPRKLLLHHDAPSSNSPHTSTKFRFQQSHNRFYVGNENRSKKVRQMDESSNQTPPTDAMLPNQAGLFLNVVRYSKRYSDDNYPKANDSKRPAISKRDMKLSTESTEIAPLTKIELHSTLSRQLFSFRSPTKDNRMTSISLSTSATPNSNPSETTALPVVASSIRTELTSKQLSTKSISTHHRRVSSTTKPLRTPTTIGLQMRTSEQPLSLSTTHISTHITTTTDSTSHSKRNSVTRHNTTKRKDITSTSSTSASDTSRVITTMSTRAELSTPSKPHTATTSQKQPTTTPYQTTTDHRSTSSTQSPPPTTTSPPPPTTTTSPPPPPPRTTSPPPPRTTTSPPPTTTTTSPPPPTTTTTTSPPPPTTTTTTTPTTTTKATTTTQHLSTSTSKAPTTTSRVATSTSESSKHSSHLLTTVTTSVVTGPGKNTTISNSSASTNTSSNSTSENDTTTFLPRRTQKKVAQEDSDYFWPLVMSLVIGIPAIIVFTIAMVVIRKKRNIDSSTFFMSPPIGDEEV